MAKKRNSCLGMLLKGLGVVVVLFIVLVGGILLYFKLAHDISIIGLIRQVKSLGNDVDIDTIAPDQFTQQDYDNLIIKLEDSGLSFLYYEDNDGNFVLKPEIDTSNITTMTSDLKLTSDELASMVDNFIESILADGDIDGLEISSDMITIYQMNFSDCVQVGTNNTRVKINIVFSFDLTILKNELNVFPVNLINRYIPEVVYINSTIILETTSEYYGYNIVSDSISINSLSAEDTYNLFESFNKLLGIGNIADLNKGIGNLFADMIIGNQLESEGIAYMLRDAGAQGFNFVFDAITEEIYFVIMI